MPKAIPRNLFLWCLASIYLFAFVSLYFQIPGLYGKDGILPARLHLKQECTDNHEKCSYWSSVGECENNPNWMLKNCEVSCNACQGRRPLSKSFWGKPTLLWFAPSLSLSVDAMMDLLCILGSFTSFCMLIHEKSRSSVLFAVLWMLYFSLYQAGQTFLWFQWDILLLETGFLAIFVAPWSIRSTYDEKPRDDITFWLIKWLIFRLMFQSGVVKLTSECPTWWGLTALNYHYESQCIPTSLAWYAHQLPEWFQKFSVAMTFIIEIGIPFLFFSPWRPLRIFSFYAQILLQLLIILTGNYNFFNILTIVLCYPLLDDQFFIDNIPSVISKAMLPASFHHQLDPKKSKALWKRIISLIMKIISGAFILHYAIKYFGFQVHREKTLLSEIAFTKDEYTKFLEIAVPLSIGLAVVSFVYEVIQSFYKCLKLQGVKSKIVSCLQTSLFVLAATWLFSVSIVPYTEIDHNTQSNIWPVVHRWYRKADKYQISNSYGLFRRMTGVGGRPELIIEGSDDVEGPWKEYHFHYKPGRLDEAPKFLIPHQPRLDWQMWFAALGSYQYNPWFISLIDKLLNNKKDVLALLAKNPFHERAPQFIKSTLYLYGYTKLPRNTSSLSDGIIKARKIKKWWKRRNPTEYTPPLSKNNPDVKKFLLQTGLIFDGAWPEYPSGFLFHNLMRFRSQILYMNPTMVMINILLLAIVLVISKSVTLR